MALEGRAYDRQLPGMAILDWPSDERRREKLFEKGAASLSDAELLAILLRTGTRGHSALDLARNMLKSFHSLRKLIVADRQRFCAGRGLGLARFAELQAAVEIARRQLSETLRAGRAPQLFKSATTVWANRLVIILMALEFPASAAASDFP
jgi:DNA repair protein RadC